MQTRPRFSAAASTAEGYNAAAERDANIIGQRLFEARKRKGLTLAELSSLLGQRGLAIQKTGLQRWESGQSIPNAYQLLAVCHALDITSVLDYFSDVPDLNGEGMKKLAEYKADLVATGKYRPQPKAPSPKIIYIEKPVSNLPASAGTGEFLDENSFEMVRFPASTVPEDAEFGIRVSGDSMEPVYHDGQIVWVRSCDSLIPGEVGIMMYDGEGYLKVYNEQEPAEALQDAYTDSEGVLHMQPVLVSYNEKYAPKVVSPELNFCVVGRVLN